MDFIIYFLICNNSIKNITTDNKMENILFLQWQIIYIIYFIELHFIEFHISCFEILIIIIKSIN